MLSNFHDNSGNLTKGMVGVNMENGLDAGTFREIVTEMVQQRAAIRNIYEVAGAIEFEYTFWAKPDNKSAVRQNLVDVSTYTDKVGIYHLKNSTINYAALQRLQQY